MRSRLSLPLLLLLLGIAAASDPDWWKTSVLYQVYPRSFADSDGDGNGDLKGVLSRVPYLKKLGVGVVWLSPILESPWEDMGYDISDYKKVHPIYGTTKDVINLIKSLHRHGMKLLMDLVPNHTSDKHAWFQKSKTGTDPEYRDFYVWKEPKGWNGSTPIPPNNWLSEFGGSAWEWVPERSQFYLHQFGKYQADLNFNNPAVVEALKDVMRYWLDLGMDGFRVDAVPFMVEDPLWRDEPETPACSVELKRTCLVHTRTENQPKTYEILADIDGMMREEYPGRFLFLEAYASLEDTIRYYNEVSTPFNFALIRKLTRESDALDLKEIIDSYTRAVPSGKPYNWVVGNHDNPRAGSRFGEELIDAVNMLVLLLPGVGVTYQGEEIGMVDGMVRKDQLVDTGDNRDPERTPFQWDSCKHAGFSSGNSTWLPANPNYWTVNVEKESKSPSSHYSTYRKLIRLRNELKGSTDFQSATIGRWVFAFKRNHQNKSILVVINLNNVQEDIFLSEAFPDIPSSAKVRIPSNNADYDAGRKVRTKESLSLRPRSGIVLAYNTSHH